MSPELRHCPDLVAALQDLRPKETAVVVRMYTIVLVHGEENCLAIVTAETLTAASKSDRDGSDDYITSTALL